MDGAHEHDHDPGGHDPGDHDPGGHGHDSDRHDDHDPGGHGHGHGHGLVDRLRDLVVPHSHDLADRVDGALESSDQGNRALLVSVLGLGLTAVLQAVVVALSGSVALLGDTLHNAADALTAIPLFIAFSLGRRAATRRYTYGFGRAEDLAGVVIVVVIAVSAVVSATVAGVRLLHPAAVDHLPMVAAASIVGFAGNEVVARYRIGVGRRIGSAALVADGLHARADGLTSLAVLVGAAGVGLGFRQADPIVGLLITVAIIVVLRQAAREVYRRLMDAVDPALVERAVVTLGATSGVVSVGEVRLRWVGHRLRAECAVRIDGAASVVDGHRICLDAEHRLIHAMSQLAGATVHADPDELDGEHHADLDHHRTLASPDGERRRDLG